jgi:O-antigen polysaccharide polymerase Wzy
MAGFSSGGPIHPSDSRRICVVAAPARLMWSAKRRYGRERSALVYAVLIAGFATACWELGETPGWWGFIGIGTALTALTLLYALRRAGFEWQSAPIAYLTVLWLFHFPLTLLAAMGVRLDSSLPGYVLSWLDGANWYRGAAFADVCAAGFMLGCILARRRWAAKRTGAVEPSPWLFYAGLAIAGLAAFRLALLFADNGGRDIFSESYRSLYNSLFGGEFALACFLVTVGSIMSVLNATPGRRWIPLVLQGVVSATILLTGSRQFALIGVLVLIAVAVKAGLRIKPGVLLTGGVVVLLAISAVATARSHGVLASLPNIDEISPKAALAEMGGSLETVSLAITWIESGDRLQLGGGYWLPFERGLGLLVPGVRTDLATDPRAMSEVLVSRVSGLGGSAVAEAYYNFGFAGAGVFVAMGYLLGCLEVKAGTSAGVALTGVVLYAVTFQIRNWFLSVPAMIAVGAIPILVGMLLQQRRGRSQSSDRAPATRIQVPAPVALPPRRPAGAA